MSTTDQWDGLKPQNVVQAARADIERRKRNEKRDREGTPDRAWALQFGYDMEKYAFLREHVRGADGAFGIISKALKAANDLGYVDDETSWAYRLAKTTNTSAKHLYNARLLQAALDMERS